jgi:glyoxylase-like metal-dependent hydrolase (beta-lactamase superfamily II)
MMAFKDTTLVVSQSCIDDMPRSVNLKKWSLEAFDDVFLLEDEISVEFHHVAGHTIDSSVAFIPEEKVLFGGDLFFEKTANFGLPFMGFYRNRPRSDGNPEEHIAAYKKFKEMKVETIVPGHGNLITNAQDHLDVQIKFFQDLGAFMVFQIQSGMALEEITLPELEPIAQAYYDVENREKKAAARRWLDTYLEKLKVSFYTYYSSRPDPSI